MLSPRRPWDGRRVVLGVTGGIAAYKSVQLARDLTRLGAAVDVVLTGAATRFVQPLSFEGVTGRPAYTDLFSAHGAATHIRLAQEADALCVAPATADLIARSAHGRSNDLLSTTILATRAPVLICPAMNDRMYAHPQTQLNVRHLADVLGYTIAGPAVGPLAVGEGEGPGRMIEPTEILDWIGRALGHQPDWAGRKVLVTAGPTREALDPVRYLGNRSSGRMGFAVARAAWRRGAEVILVTGPSSLDDPPGVETRRVESALEMMAAAREVAGEADVCVFAAAVADYRPADPASEKLKRGDQGERMSVEFTANPDIAAAMQTEGKEGQVRVGFALETGALLKNARAKLEQKGLHLIVANSAVEEGSGFDSDTNRVTILDASRQDRALPLLSKDEVAEEILDCVAEILSWASSADGG